METDRLKWNKKFSSRLYELKQPEPFVVRHIDLLHNKTVLDLACGDGRNAIYLASKGYSVTAIDISDVALDRLTHFAKEVHVQIATKQMNLEFAEELEQMGVFDNILVNSYKPSQALWNKLPSLLQKDGILIMTVFNMLQHHKHGFSSQFCAEEGEYLEATLELEALEYEKLSYNEKYLDGYVFRRK